MSLTVGQLRERLANLPAHTPVFVRHGYAPEVAKPAAQPDRATLDVEQSGVVESRRAAFVIAPVVTPGNWWLCTDEDDS